MRSVVDEVHMDRLTKSGSIVSQRDINQLLELSNENQFGANEAYYKLKHYEDLEEEGRLIIRSGINVKELYEQVIVHMDSMTDEEWLESASRAAEMTSGCDDDWHDDLVQVVRCKYCKNRYTTECPMFHYRHDLLVTFVPETSDYTTDDGFCNIGVAR